MLKQALVHDEQSRVSVYDCKHVVMPQNTSPINTGNGEKWQLVKHPLPFFRRDVTAIGNNGHDRIRYPDRRPSVLMPHRNTIAQNAYLPDSSSVHFCHGIHPRPEIVVTFWNRSNTASGRLVASGAGIRTEKPLRALSGFLCTTQTGDLPAREQLGAKHL